MSVDSNLLLVRSKASVLGFTVREGSVDSYPLFANLESIAHAPSALPLTFDSQGLLFASSFAHPGQLTIQSAVTGEIISELSISEVLAAEFSPLGTYLVTFSRPIKGSATDAGEGNLKIWRVSDGSVQGSYHQKTLKKDTIQWDKGETVCMRIVTNELHVLRGQATLEGIIGKLYHKGCSQFKLAPVSNGCAAYVVVFNPEAGGKPAKASIHKLGKIGDPELSEAINARTMFSANEANLHWNSLGNDYNLASYFNDY